MKKTLYLYLIFLFTVACSAQPQSTPDVAAMVNSTLTAIAQQQGNPPISGQPTLQTMETPQPIVTSASPTLPAPPATSGDQSTSVQIQHIELQQGAQACTTDAEYIISAKVTGAANTEVSYTVSSQNNGIPGDGMAIMLDNNGGYDVNTGIRGPFSDPGNVQITITVLVNGQAVNYASDFICQAGEYKQ